MTQIKHTLLFIAAIIFCIIASNVNAQQATFTGKIEDTKSFFKNFCSHKKGEFETTEQFNKRVGIIDSTKYYYFATDNNDSKYEYDADNKTLKITYDNNWLLSDRKKTGSHMGVTNGGIKFKIYKESREEFYFSAPITHFSDGTTWDNPMMHPNKEFILKNIEPSIAKELSKEYRVIMGVQFKGYQNAEISKRMLEASLSEPWEGTLTEYTITLNDLKWYIINKKTGEILKTILKK